jgi:hypothetical protein
MNYNALDRLEKLDEVKTKYKNGQRCIGLTNRPITIEYNELYVSSSGDVYCSGYTIHSPSLGWWATPIKSLVEQFKEMEI